MTTDEKIKLIQEVGEEIVGEDELRKLLDSGEEIVAYDGFEPSGQIHIAQGLLRAININKMTKAGMKFKMWVADWHAMANNKMGGDLDKIQTVGRYFIEVWRASGMDLSKVEFLWASDMAKDPNYWKLVVQVGRTNALRRFVRTAEMMGRDESLDNLTGAHIIYSCMQVADIFMLGAKVTQLGMDQRKVNMLAREIGPQLGYWKPVVVSHHMLMGLTPPHNVLVAKSDTPAEELLSGVESLIIPNVSISNKTARTIALKMSKSNPDSAIFMTDTLDDIQRKINKAFCPEGTVTENPVLDYCKYIIFESFDRLGVNSFIIKRPEKWGGNVEFHSYRDLEVKFANKEIHPQDLKVAVTKALDELLSPVRRHFEEDAHARTLFEKVKSYQVTR